MTSRLVRTCVLLLLAGTAQAGLAASTAADRPADNGVTLERIMSDADWMGNAPEDAFWAPDGQRIYYRQKEQGSKIRDLHGLDPATGKSTKVAAEALAQADTGDGAFDLARARYVYVHDGDIFVRLLANGKTRQITRTPEVESHARFMADGRHVAFMSGDNWYLYDLDSGLVSRAADVETGKDPAEKDRSFDYLKSQQKRIFRTLREAAEEKDQEREHDRALQKADPTAGPLPFYLGDDIKILDKSLSPAGHYMLVVTQKADYDEGKHGTMPNYVTDSGYVETKEERTKVSRNAPAPQQLWMLDLAGHRMEKLDLTVLPKIESDPLAKLRKSALKWHVAHGEDADAVKKALKAPDVRPVTVGGIVWSDDGSQVAVQFRAIDNKDRWLATVNFDKARLVPRHRLHDDAWINWNFNDFGWLRDNRTLW
ncbi:MAG: S9 family peptidase, partial [Gammaproteobacteria bacterium]